jgi:aldehyde:ferredoxin oxidoreductase
VPAGRPGAEGPEYETLWALGAACGIDDLDAIQEANRLCGEYGLDTISTGATIACAMELSERGALGRVLRFGDAERMVELVAQIGAGGGFGVELQDGSARLSARYGHPELSMHVKGLELPAYDPRAMHGQGLAYATSNRGACHLRGNMVGPEILGIPKMIDRFASAGKSGILMNLQHLSAVFDSVGLCKFAGFAFGEEIMARLLSACRGELLGAQDLLRAGERIWNLERLWNVAAGFSAADDTLPSRLLTEPLAEGPSAGRTVHLAPMLGEYYRARGWDEHGVPSAKKVVGLGLEAVAAALDGGRFDTHAGPPPWQGWRPDVAEEEVRVPDTAHAGATPVTAGGAAASVDPAEGGRHLRAVP